MCHVHVYVHIHLTLHLCPIYIHLQSFTLYIETNGKMTSMYISLYENGHLFVHFTTYTNSEYHTLNFPYVYAWCVNFHKMLTVMALHQVIWNDNPIIYIYINLDRSSTIINLHPQTNPFPPDFLHAVAPSGLDPALERRKRRLCGRRRKRRRPHAARCGFFQPWLGGKTMEM